MWQNAHDAYLESRILSADPLELVKLLYQGAITSVQEARRRLANGEILERARAISKTCAILSELSVSLDHERGGNLSHELARLYDYMIRRLIEANLKQADQPLEEVLGLLSTLAEGWEGIQQPAPEPEPEPQAASPWAQPYSPAPAETVSEYSSHAWSL